MKLFIKTIVFAVLVAALLLAAIFSINYFGNGIVVKQGTESDLPTISGDISVLNWNLGYAGLGKDSDFYMDGGEMFSPPSKATVEINLAGIRNILAKNRSDFHFFQEISAPDMLTLGVDVLKGVKGGLPGYNMHYSSDFRTKFLPTKYALRHGLGVFNRVNTSSIDIIRLTNEPTRLGGVVRRQYHIVASEFEHQDGTQWVLLNIHLSAFDEGGNVRLKQLDELIEFADTLYQAGKHVIVVGIGTFSFRTQNSPQPLKRNPCFGGLNCRQKKSWPDGKS